MRAHYLRTVRQFRQDGYQIVYLDETWVNKNHCTSHTWLPNINCSDILNLISNKDLKLPKIPSGKGKRLIILDAGSAEEGFIDGCREVFLGKHIDGDYHKEMDSIVFMRWFTNDLLPALKRPSLIVLDNASYHNLRVPETVSPTTATTKPKMQEWLQTNGINYDPLMTKVELYEIIKRHKQPTRYVTDDLAEKHGHFVLRTPVRHCELNPIELVWAQVKQYVAVHNSTFTMAAVRKLTHEAMDTVTAKNWSKCAEHTKKIEQRMCEQEGIHESIEPLIINVESSDDDSDTQESSVSGTSNSDTDDYYNSGDDTEVYYDSD